MQEEDIIQLLRDRDEKGLSLIYDHYAATLNGIIVRIVKSPNEAEEILQQTFLKVWNGIDTYDNEKSTLYTWMARIARNTAIDKVRLKSFENQQKTESLNLPVHDNDRDYINTNEIDVNTLTANLDKKYKDVIDHVYLMGYSHADAAKKLDIPVGTVKTRLRFAIKELKNHLSKEKKLFLGFLIISLLIMLLVWI
jgi:RNA polymerase sigma-70 factor (ECF subfamily)